MCAFQNSLSKNRLSSDSMEPLVQMLGHPHNKLVELEYVSIVMNFVLNRSFILTLKFDKTQSES